ncbi:hypothetical protein EGT07_15285 [Herbaspirillum sp. HC18]|nr:hypothetical protein EGT07_15285 [Herbaspirillum sp. HC18]
MKRKLLKLIALLPWMAGCSVAAHTANTTGEPQVRFKGIGLVLVVDAVPSAEMKEVVFYDDRGVRIYTSATVARRNREIMALSSARIPLTVRITWRKGAGWDNVNKVWNEGAVVGDYTIPVAERIPDDVLNDIRAHGGALRLKFRLKPDGILFGWDIERDGAGTGYTLKFDMPGGDFKEARIYNGKVAEPGWEIQPEGRKISTDY